MNISIFKVGKGGTFWKDLTDQYVVFLDAAFLPGSLWIAIEDTGPSCAILKELQVMYALEFRAVIRKDHRKQFPEQIDTKKIGKTVKDCEDAFLGLVRQEKDQHEIGISEKHGEKHFAAVPGPDNRVHFNNRKIRVRLHVGGEIGVRAAFPVLVLELSQDLVRAPLPIPYFPGKIDIPHFKGTHVDVIIDGLFGKPNLGTMSSKDVIDRLSLGNKRCKQIVYLNQPFRRGANPFSGNATLF